MNFSALRPKHRKSHTRAEGILELLIVLATVALLAVVVMAPRRLFGRRCVSCPRTQCVNNLRQVGLAARIWSNDHDDLFPWSVSMSSNGVKEIATSGNVAALLLSMSNELNSPKILYCPTDTKRKRAADFSKFSNNNLSYFIGLDADETMPQTILSGDRNISGGVFTSNRVMEVRATNVLAWGKDMHVHNGNIGLGDGSVQQMNDIGLQRQVLGQATNAVKVARFALP